MPFSPETLIAGRYQLLECLGAGGMGEVWKARDTNFSRLIVVAVKLLKEDETLADDVRQRSNFERYVKREAAAGPLTVDLVIGALDEAFNIGFNLAALKESAAARFRKQPISPEDALRFFDELAGDSTYNENARHRRRLRDLFATEANSVAVLQHPNIVRVTDYGDQSGVPFLVMDFISGRTLQQVIQRRESMPLTRRLRLMEDLCEGLGYAHAKDLVHRDIKPANLIIDGETQRLRILDFGVARTMQFSAQRSVSRGAPIGTYCYMSPEQTRAARTLDNRSDIFAVGLVFYEFLALQRAFPSTGDLSELISRIQRDPPPPLRDLLPDLDPEIERIVNRAIEKVPAKRYQDLTDMQRELEAVRRRLEEDERRQSGSLGSRSDLVKPKPLLQRITDLIDRAQNAFDSEDDHAAVGFCDEALSLMPRQPDAIELKERCLARIKVRIVEGLVADGRQLLDQGDLSGAESLLRRPELESNLPVIRQFALDVEAHRRTRRVKTLVSEARAHLAASAFPQAIGRAQSALEIDASDADAHQVLADARRAMLQQRQEHVAATLREADAAAAEQRLDDALHILRTVADESAVKGRIAMLERQRDEQAARQAALERALANARASMARGDVIVAHSALVEARSIDPTSPELLHLDAALTPIVRAMEHLNSAVALFDQDQPAEAHEQLEAARVAFGSAEAPMPAVQQLIDSADRARVSQTVRAEVRESRIALEAGRLEEALDHARAALGLVADDDDARSAVQQAQAAMHARLEQTVDAAIKTADAHASEQQFDEAIGILTPFADHPRVKRRMEALVGERDAVRARTAALAEALERTTRLLEGEDFAGALAALSRARALDETNDQVAEQERWLLPLISALETVARAIGSYQADDLETGDRTIESAAAALEPYAGKYASVRDRLAGARSARSEAVAREDSRRQREAEAEEARRREAEREEQERIARARDEAGRRVTSALEDERFDEADRELARLTELPGSEPLVAELRAAHAAARTAFAAREATRHRDAARLLVARGRLEEALAALEAYAPTHAVITAEIALVEAAIHERDQARAREIDAARAREQAERERQAAERALAEEEERARQALDERADQAIAAADELFLAGARLEAIEQLAAFAPPHEYVLKWLAALRGEHERLEAVARAEEAARLQRALDERAAEAIASADALFLAGTRLDAIAQLAAFTPPHAGVTERLAVLRREHEQLEAAARAEEAARLQRALDERAAEAIASADALFLAGTRLDAIAQLAAFTPPHAGVTDRLTVLRREHEQLEAAARAEAERQQREAEHARLQAERQDLVKRAREAGAARDYAAALELVAAAQRLTPADHETAQLRRELLTDVRAAQRQDSSNAALQSLLVQYDRAGARRRLVTRAAMAAAALLLVSGIGASLYFRPSAPPAPASGPAASSSSAPAANTQPQGAAVDLPVAPVEPQATPSLAMGSLTVNLRPWARVRITSRDTSGAVPAEPQLTPFMVSLLPGEYTLIAENDGITPRTEFSVTVEPGKVTLVSRDMPGFSPDRTVDALLGTNR